MLSDLLRPRYPIYIPSKSRVNPCHTAKCLAAAGVPFHLVVEPQEHEMYAARFGEDHVIDLPENDQGLIYARNWIKQHATVAGAERHWQLDDNIRQFWRRYHAKRVHCDAGIALRVCEDFSDRYENVAISGLNYYMFAPDDRYIQPVQINCHVYSCTLVNNSISFGWRLVYNDDTDICLQALAHGWCTVLLNTFLAHKIQTMKVHGGNTDQLYLPTDGRLKMARSLERVWPGVVTTDRRFQRPQHKIYDGWKRFDTPLKLKPGLSLEQLAQVQDEYDLKLVQVAKSIKSPQIRSLFKDWQAEHGKY